uniref:chitin synthase n=1 Tax=Polyphagotarsonemus latus TaxID=1204166 RepID=A0AAN0LHG8_9ACAR
MDYTTCEQEIKGWDVFANNPPPDEDETVDSNLYKYSIKLLKICVSIITCLTVLVCSVISVTQLLFMTSLIKPNRTGIQVCNQGLPGLDRDKRYETIFQLNDPERVAWIWCILFCLIAPEIMTLIKSIRICTFKSYMTPRFSDLFLVMFSEILHTIGVIIFVFIVLPSLNVIKGAMLKNCFCLIPGILALLSRSSKEKVFFLKILIDLLAIIGQLTALIYFMVIENQNNTTLKYMLPLSCLLISFGYWENFAGDYSSIKWIKNLAKRKEKLHRSRYFIFIIVSSVKICIMISGMLIIRYLIDGSCLYLFTQFKNAFSQHKVLIVRDKTEVLSEHDGIEEEWLELDVFGTLPMWFTFIQISTSWLAYVFGKFSCKICIQEFSFTFPLILTVPISIILFSVSCDLHLTDTCTLVSIIPRHLFWTCPNDLNSSFASTENLLWIFWIMSQIWICIHICKPKCERLATTEKLFINPMYCSAFIDQSMMMNRRKDDLIVFKFKLDKNDPDSQYQDLRNQKQNDSSTSTHYESIQDTSDDKKSYAELKKKNKEKKTALEEDYITKLLICATMWHETKEEMVQMLKSLMRLDEDQWAKKKVKKYFNAGSQDYYEFEVHIYFDDAFELDYESGEQVVNSYVKDFFEVLDEAASNVHRTEVELKPPKKYPTPYGGRLEWKLPGNNKLYIHLKDKLKIRHRKRWSQVMYMYYLLGHCLMDQPIDVTRKVIKAENTYILALDGDIDFRPGAVQLLVDLMKKNRRLGAACGRIHPVGSGPMVWYQKFEYAIGHWLQKATEHMIGCVLCSPGCFSLFRAKALMDDNVMRKYTTKAEEALHYVQYDQGEDRWLCTLLLQRGYRVEYSAASDAYTHCPEGFGEFFTQRRRWAPSTMANIMDLLGDYKRTVAINDNISLPYIIYQGMLMVGTVLGPGTIFLMLVGALVAVFRISNWYSFQLNLLPITIFMLICFTMKNQYQIMAAQFLSACYALLMMAVFVGTSIQMTEDGISSPSAMFFIALTGTFFVAALLHPQEFSCVVPIILYFLSIPSMYLLLIVYSLINLNVVTWGTREKPQSVAPKSKKQLEEEKKLQEELKKKSLLSFLNKNNNDEEDGGIVISLANLFKCMFFTHPKPNEEKIHLIQIEESLKEISSKINNLEKNCAGNLKKKPSTMSLNKISNKNLEVLSEHNENEDSISQDSMTLQNDNDDDDDMFVEDEKLERDDMVNPFWIEDKDLLDGKIGQLSEKEVNFWKDLIDKYLYPLDEDKAKQDKIASDLKDLRNRVVFGFLMVNALFILIVFLLQLNKDILYVQWPFGVRENITFIPETNEIRVEKYYLQMEPIGLVFVLFFGTILVIQFVGMLFHRFATLSHILASVELFESKSKSDNDKQLQSNSNAFQIVKRIQRLTDFDDDDNFKQISPTDLTHRNIVERCEERKHFKKSKIGTLDVAFRKRFEKYSKNELSTPILGSKNPENSPRNSNHFLDIKPSNSNGFERSKPFVRSNICRATLDNKQKKKSNNMKEMDNLGFKLEGENYDLNSFNNFNSRNDQNFHNNEISFNGEEGNSFNSNQQLFEGSNM